MVPGQSFSDNPHIESHPLNSSFSWRPVKGPFRRITGAQAEEFNELGYFVVEDAFDENTLHDLMAEIDPVEARVEALLRGQPHGKIFVAQAGEITFTVHMVRLSRRIRDFCLSPIFQDLAHDLIGADVRLYWDQAVYKKPNVSQEFPWHQDNGYTFIEPQQYFTCWVALTDTTPKNGCLRVVPGVHRFGTLRHWMTERGLRCLEMPIQAVAVPVRAGSIVVFSSVTPHCSGPNLTNEVRKAYIVQFAPDGAQSVTIDSRTGRRIYLPCKDGDRQFPVLINGQAP
jgi:phytanoyl-CoA hydroxylase